MTALASTNVTITIPAQDRDFLGPGGRKIMSMATIAFGNGTLTYPAGGVPLPVIGNFGMKKELQRMFIQQPYANGYVYKYDATNHKMLIFTQGMTTGSTTATTPGNGALVENSAGAETAVRLPNSAVDTSYEFGPLVELPAANAPAAVSIGVMVVGE